MKKQGRYTDNALNNMDVDEKRQPFVVKRLKRDLDEIDKEKIPTCGVTARPLQDDYFTWHANIRGPPGTPYEGGVFHLELKFPKSYPNHPPTIRLFNNVPHPNIFGNYICLDILQPFEVRKEEGAGWSSGYSVQSVLFQLQSFLFQEFLTQNKNAQINLIKKAVNQANQFKCSQCKHGGKLSLWPTFNQKENELKEFQVIEQENDIIRKELICYHTKLTYLQNQLGLGLKISKIPRTGLIKEGEVYYDYISIKAFLKESINKTSSNQKITHWMPVYFGNGDQKERFLHFLKKSLSMIMTNSTKNFKPEFILEVFPKLFITLVYHIMDEKKHPSIRIIRILTHIHSTFLYCLQSYPELKKQIQETIDNFIKSEEARHKNVVPNLGCILAMLSVVDSHRFKDLVEAYFSQQLDRQVFWLLKSVPALIVLQQQADKVRTQIAFKTQMTSYHIFCFYKLFITNICQKRNDKNQMLNQYDSNLCKLTNKQETYFQAQVKRISKQIVSYDDLFAYVGIKNRDENQMNQLLKNAIKNSEKKQYHSRQDVAKCEQALRAQRKKSAPKAQLTSKVSTGEEQFKKLTQNIPSYSKYISVSQVKVEVVQQQDKKEEHSFTYEEKISSDKDWRQMCVSRWSWIKEALLADPTLSSNEIAKKAIEQTQKGVTKTQGRITKIINDQYKNSHLKYDQPKVNIPETDWKRLFLRLDLQDFLKFIDMNPDFTKFYQKLYVCQKNNLSTLLIPMLDIKKLKSGYFYITALLSKITTLKYLQFTGLPQINNSMNQKAAKAIKKGLNNFYQSKGRLDILAFNQLIVNKDFSDSLFNYLCRSDSLISLRFSKTNILAYGNAMKVLSNILITLKQLREIELIKCSLDQQKCKILADSLMRMKKLQIFRLNEQKGLSYGLSSIIYNLSFSPNLLLLDLGDVVISANQRGGQGQINETVVSLHKMLRINSSIEILKLNNVPGLNPCLSRDFWSALGESKSLRVLDLSKSGDLNSRIADLGSAVAFNAKRKGILAYLNLTGTISNSHTLNTLYNGMNVSQYEEEQWYGDPNKVAKMIANNYAKQFFNNLKALQIDHCSNLNPAFNLAHYNKLVNKVQPQFVKLLANSPNLNTLHLSLSNQQKNIADILVLALDSRRQGLKCQLKVIDLSKNNLQKEGVKLLAEVLPYNHVLQVLDLSKNNIGVSGADQLAKSLKTNKSLKYLNVFNNKISYDGAKSIAQNIVANHPNLQFLELGHNRIRDKGFSAIINALLGNQNTNLKILGLKFNFLTNQAVIQNFRKITEAKTKLEQVFITNNLINEQGIYKLRELVQKSNSQISIDQLQRVKYLDQQRLDRTVWIHPINQINLAGLKNFFEIVHKCGIIVDFRVRNGKKYPNKSGENKFCFVQFAQATSVTVALTLASKGQTHINGKKFRVFKAGTGTFIYSKKSAKEKKLQEAKLYLPRPPFPALDIASFPGLSQVPPMPTMGMQPPLGMTVPRPFMGQEQGRDREREGKRRGRGR